MGSGATAYCRFAHVQAWLGPRPVLHDITLELHHGEHTVVLGPNGAGKTALIKLLCRELYPVVTPTMRLELFGQSQVNLWQLRRRLGRQVRSARALIDLQDGVPVQAAGVVTHRQRPGTASGVVFLSLEDETGIINVIVFPSSPREAPETAQARWSRCFEP